MLLGHLLLNKQCSSQLIHAVSEQVLLVIILIITETDTSEQTVLSRIIHAVSVQFLLVIILIIIGTGTSEQTV